MAFQVIRDLDYSTTFKGFPLGSAVKNLPGMQVSTCNTRNVDSCQSREDPLDKEKATQLQYSCLRKIPWTEEPDGLQSEGSQRARHNLATKPLPPPLRLNLKCRHDTWFKYAFFTSSFGWCCESAALNMPANLEKLSSGHSPGKGQFSFQSQRKAMPKNVQTTAELHSSHMLTK